MTEDSFVQERAGDWDRLAAYLGDRKSRRGPGAADFPALYRRVCQDLNQAQAARYSPATTERLDRLVWEGHRRLYALRPLRASVLADALVSAPRRLRALWKPVLAAALLFYGTGALAFLQVRAKPEDAGRFLNAEMRAMMKEMYDPASEHFLKPRDVSNSADMFGYYIYHNIGIGFETFAGGVVAGAGALFFLVYNGMQLGAVAAYLAGLGDATTFFPFVVTHGAFELNAIVLFGAAGLLLGWSLAAPGRLSRADAFRARAREVLPLAACAFAFLVIAAALEAFWSPLPMPTRIKYLSGGAAWLLVVSFFLFGGRRRA